MWTRQVLHGELSPISESSYLELCSSFQVTVCFCLYLLVQCHCSPQPCLWAAVFSKKKALINPLFTTCPAPHCREATLAPSWWSQWKILTYIQFYATEYGVVFSNPPLADITSCKHICKRLIVLSFCTDLVFVLHVLPRDFFYVQVMRLKGLFQKIQPVSWRSSWWILRYTLDHNPVKSAAFHFQFPLSDWMTSRICSCLVESILPLIPAKTTLSLPILTIGKVVKYWIPNTDSAGCLNVCTYYIFFIFQVVYCFLFFFHWPECHQKTISTTLAYIASVDWVSKPVVLN